MLAVIVSVQFDVYKMTMLFIIVKIVKSMVKSINLWFSMFYTSVFKKILSMSSSSFLFAKHSEKNCVILINRSGHTS